MARRALVRRWADRAVRITAAAALQLAGFTSVATALASTPEIVDPETEREARSRVNAALTTLLLAREIPQTEPALIATWAAREALALASSEDPSEAQVRSLVETLQTLA